MTTLFVRHQVADYAQWRQVYDGFAPTQKALGVQDQAVYQAIDNPNDITVRHEFATLEAAQAGKLRPSRIGWGPVVSQVLSSPLSSRARRSLPRRRWSTP